MSEVISSFKSLRPGSHVVTLCRFAYYVVVVCPLQPSSSANAGCLGPESSDPVSSQLACPISSQVTDHWGALCN